MKPLHIKQHAKRKHRQAGITLIEIGVSLAIFAAVIAGALALFTSTSTSQKVLQLNTDLVSLRGGIQQIFVQSSTYGTDDSEIADALIKSKRYPITFTPVGSGFRHMLNGTIKITGHEELFVIEVNGLDQDACILLATQTGGWFNLTKTSGKPTGAEASGDANPIKRAELCADPGPRTLYFWSR
jgi:type II secretory pathway pseudopilin PulG